MTNERKAVILARVSSKSQEDEGYSLDSQLKLLRNYCNSRQLTIDKEFKIAESASKEQSRKVFHEMMGYLRTGKVFHLTVEKTDRLTRNFRDAVAIDDWLEKDVRRQVHAVKENILLHKEAKSDVKFMWNIHLSVAKKYTDNLREEAMKGWAEKLAQGWLPAPPPPGYMTITQGGKRIHVLDPAIAPLVKHIFELYLEPSHSIESIAEEMKRIGITTRKGRPYSKSHVQRIMNNPFYIGINRFDGRDYPGAQEPLLSKELFNGVQAKMHGRRPIRYRKHNAVFKNIITCGECGGLVTWQLQKGRYYGCCQGKTSACRGRKMLREDRIEETIIRMLGKLVSPSPEVIDWAQEAMRSRHEETIETGKRLEASIRTQLERVMSMDRNLYDDKLAGDITRELYIEKHEALMAEKAALEAKLAGLDQSLQLQLEKRLVLLELTQKAAELYPQKSPEQKRIIITKLFKQMTYKDGSVSVNFTTFTRLIALKVQETKNVLGGTA